MYRFKVWWERWWKPVLLVTISVAALGGGGVSSYWITEANANTPPVWALVAAVLATIMGVLALVQIGYILYPLSPLKDEHHANGARALLFFLGKDREYRDSVESFVEAVREGSISREGEEFPCLFSDLSGELEVRLWALKRRRIRDLFISLLVVSLSIILVFGGFFLLTIP